MPVTISNPVIRTNPLSSYNYALFVGKMLWGWFIECSNITIERAVQEYPEGGMNHFVHQLPGRITQANITLKHGLAGDELWRWFQQGAVDGRVDRHHISIVVYDGMLTPVAWWNLYNAYPVRWSGPTLKSDSHDAVIEEVVFAYTGSYGGETSAEILQRAAYDSTNRPQIGQNPEVNLPALAHKVYKLLQDELRVERERRGRKRR